MAGLARDAPTPGPVPSPAECARTVSAATSAASWRSSCGGCRSLHIGAEHIALVAHRLDVARAARAVARRWRTRLTSRSMERSNTSASRPCVSCSSWSRVRMRCGWSSSTRSRRHSAPDSAHRARRIEQMACRGVQPPVAKREVGQVRVRPWPDWAAACACAAAPRQQRAAKGLVR